MTEEEVEEEAELEALPLEEALAVAVEVMVVPLPSVVTEDWALAWPPPEEVAWAAALAEPSMDVTWAPALAGPLAEETWVPATVVMVLPLMLLLVVSRAGCEKHRAPLEPGRTGVTAAATLVQVTKPFLGRVARQVHWMELEGASVPAPEGQAKPTHMGLAGLPLLLTTAENWAIGSVNTKA